MAQGVDNAVRLGTTVFHACATFKEARIDTGAVNDFGRPKYKYRTQDNAAFVKSLWLDLDCGEGKDYPTQRDAILDLVRFVKEARLPRPAVVNSGYGVHAYWAFTKEVTAVQWVKIAHMWRAVADHFKIKHDANCTTDVCRILRPIGSRNMKYGQVKEVRLVGTLPEPTPVMDLVAIIKGHVSTNKLQLHALSGPRPVAVSTMNNDLAITVEYPPADATVMATHCQQVADFREAQGNVEEPLWYAMLGLVKHAIGGEAICHEWSSGHPAYNPQVTQQKIVQWVQGPTTCAKLAQLNPTPCTGCVHAGKVKSPIQLGTVAPAPVPVEDVNPETNEVERLPEIPANMRDRFSWDGTKLCAYLKDEESGVRKAVPICTNYMFARQSHRKNIAGEPVVQMVWVVRDKPGVYREFELSGDAIGVGGRELFAALGRQGIVTATGGKRPMEQYVSEWFAALRASSDEVNSLATFGWHNDDFLIGDTLLCSNGERKTVRLQGDTLKYVEAFREQGDLEFWKQGIDNLYNRPNHEHFQWTFGVGFGAPLVHLWGGGMAGCVINGYSAETGFGKSTAGKLALGMYGNPEKLALTKQQATTKGLFAYCGLMRSLPILLDEVTNASGYELSELVYTFSQGTGRIGAQSDGSLRSNVYEWATLMATTSNKSVHTALSAVKGDASPEIARVFDFNFHRPTNLMAKEEADELIPELFNCSGIAGRAYVQYVVANQEKIKELMKKVRIEYTRRSKATASERYWVAGAVVNLTGLMIAKSLGMIQFDIKTLFAWSLRQFEAMRGQSADASIDITEHFGTMLNELAPGFLVTDREGDARMPNSRAVVIHQPRSNILNGRVLNDSKTLYLPISVMRKWCADNQLDYKSMSETLVAKSWASVGAQPYALGKGTADYATAPSRCFKINLAIAGGDISAVDSVTKLSRVQ